MKKSFWTNKGSNSGFDKDRESLVEPLLADPEKFERPPEGDDASSGIRVRHLRKTFANGQVVAVDDLDVNMYPGEVFSLLGHNGAYVVVNALPCLSKLHVKSNNCFLNSILAGGRL